jgi:hypothetical protein
MTEVLASGVTIALGAVLNYLHEHAAPHGDLKVPEHRACEAGDNGAIDIN